MCVYPSIITCTSDKPCVYIDRRKKLCKLCDRIVLQLRQWLVLERKTRGKYLHLAKRFGPKRAFFSCKEVQNKSIDLFCTSLQLKKALLGPKRFAK